MDELTAKQEVIQAGLALVDRGLVARTWGNISCRIDDNHFAITPSGMGYERITPAEVVVVDKRTLSYQGTVKPSGETGIHAAVYRLHKGANCVIHTHQRAASALSVAGYGALRLTDAERTLLGCDPIPRAAYALPSTKALCRNVTRVLETTPCAALFMARHGLLTMGCSRATAFARAEAVETICLRALKSEAPKNKRPFHPEAMITAIWGAHPALGCVTFIDDDPVVRVSEAGRLLIPMLDDFAQLIGVDVRCIPPEDPTRAPSAISRRNALLIQGCGALCAGATLADAEAVASLLIKECETQINARLYGGASPLPFVDRAIMRSIYVNRYSRLK